ncbi:luciferase family protein [Haloarchaeobius sp. HRN-SO-5]|uniref:luciferase domain-containing protein n=1 Tax=Haloarchaeobius sp. HRN-SO-5 TaxID=3446118 RepID=UPI003EB8C72A
MEDRLTLQVVDAIATEVTAWPGVTDRDHRSGGRAFYLGTAEVGHVHRSGLVDVEFYRPLGDRLVAAGLVRAHSLYPDSGWTSYRVVDADGIDHAVWLLWVSYLATLVATPHTHLARRIAVELDVDAALDALPAPVAAELESLRRSVPLRTGRASRA